MGGSLHLLCWSEYYTPYGDKVDNDDQARRKGCGLIGNDRGYTSHVQDKTGLVYAQQRYYDPVVGRFISIDFTSRIQLEYCHPQHPRPKLQKSII